METAAISYRVVDFLKKHPPFHAMGEGDLLGLAQQGRVRFFEKNEYILWQGASRFEILVIQQGTVCLWDEAGANAELRDIRGAGDMLGIDLLNAGSYAYSARSASDVLVYAFPADDFQALVNKYPYAGQYVSAHGGVTPDYQPPEERREPQHIFLHDLVARNKLAHCSAQTSIREAARYMLTTGADAIAVPDSEHRARAVLTANFFLEWIKEGGGDAQEPIESLLHDVPHAIAPDASVTDGVLAMGAADTDALTITSNGRSDGQLHAIVTHRDLAKVFGDQPAAILREIRRAAGISPLRELNQRARAFALQYLTNAGSIDWLARFISLTDAGIVKRIVAIEDPEESLACWCFCASSGRGESLVGLAPQLLVILDDDHDHARSSRTYQGVLDSFGECGYLPRVDMPFEPSFYAAPLAEWRKRYVDWVRDPIFKAMYRARPLFDLRPIHGRQALWHEVEAAVTGAIDQDFLHILANDCLSSLPPLTFFEDAVVEVSGGQTSVFRLEDNALRPLVDVGRVFAMAARKVLGSSTLERFEMARALQPGHESIFREASETLRTLLWQQGRVGISQGTAGSELPPALLSRYDRQVLRSGFRSIQRLLEFTADREWLKIP